MFETYFEVNIGNGVGERVTKWEGTYNEPTVSLRANK